MRLDEWLKYVEQVEKNQQTGAEPSSANGALSKNAQDSNASDDTLKQQAAQAAAQTQTPAIRQQSEPADKTKLPHQAKGAEIFKSSIEDLSERPAYLDDELVDELALSSEVLIEAPPAIEREPNAPSFHETPLRAEDLDLHIPEIEDFLTFLKDPQDPSETPPDPQTDLISAEVPLSDSTTNVLEPSPSTSQPATPQAEPVSTAALERSKSAASIESTKSSSPSAKDKVKTLETIESLPRHIQTLARLDTEEIAQNSYKRNFRESRGQMIERLLDPPLSLEDAARILNVCPTTVRRYTNRGVLPHYRTVGNQRRFRLSDVIAFMETHADRLAKRRKSDESAQAEPPS